MDSPTSYQFLTHQPETADQLGGGHDRLANSLVDSITKTQCPGPIAILGPLGSGKSTVLKLVTEKISADKNLLVFTFDTWSHEKDPLRSTFLEDLIYRLIDESWLDQKTWKEKAEAIGGTRISTSTKKANALTFSVLVNGIYTVLIASTITVLINLYGKDDKGPIAAQHLLSIVHTQLIVVSVIIILCLVLVIAIPKYNFLKLAWDALFTRVEESRTTTINSKDASPAQFRIHFSTILKEIFQENADRKLIVVLDNIDRSADTDVSKLWSLLELCYEDVSTHKYLPRLWTIVPFDHRLIKAEKGEQIKLIEKIFAVQFRMPSVALKPVSQYLEKQLRTVFPAEILPSDILWKCVHIFQLKNGTYKMPRELKHFVNSISAFSNEWNHELPIHDIAAYVLFTNDDDILQLISGKVIPESVTALLSSDWTNTFISLNFHVSAESARHTLFAPMIYTAFEKGDASELVPVMEVDGFCFVMESVFLQSWTRQVSQSVEKLFNFVIVLDVVDIDQKYQKLWAMLSEAALEVPSWHLLDKKLGEAICKLIGRQPDSVKKQFACSLLNRLSNPIDDSSLDNFCVGLLPIFDTIEHIAEADEDLIRDNFVIPNSSEMMLQVTNGFRRKVIPEKYFQYFKPPSGLVIKFLSNFQLSDDLGRACRTCFELWEDQIDADALAKSIVTELLDGDRSSFTAYANGVCTLIWLTLNKHISFDYLKKLAYGAWLFIWFSVSAESATNAHVALLLAIILVDPKAEIAHATITEDKRSSLDASIARLLDLNLNPPAAIIEAMARIFTHYDLWETFEPPETNSPMVSNFAKEIRPMQLRHAREQRRQTSN